MHVKAYKILDIFIHQVMVETTTKAEEQETTKNSQLN